MNDSVPSFPSTFSGSSRAVGTSVKAKPQSLNIVSPTANAIPRPLHLTLGSVVSAPSPNSTSSSPFPGPSSSVETPAIHSTVTSATNGVNPGPQKQQNEHPNSNSNPTHSASSTSRAPSPSPLSPTITGLRKHPSSRRQSSISYISSNGHSPSPSHAHFGNGHGVGKRESVDGGLGLVRSPLASAHPNTTFFGDAVGVGLSRSHSLGGRGGPKSPRSPGVGERSSTGSLLALTGQDASKDKDTGAGQVKERPPVTLAEKHAELLHFIAQKESKCLELRSQLAVHESELLQLKRKWERIVNRGFERALSPSCTTTAFTASTSPVPLSASLLSSPSPNSPFPPPAYAYSPSSSSSTSNPSSFFPTLTPTANAPGAGVVLEGIKGGVQGMSRLIAAGLESIVNVNGPATPTAATSTPTANETKFPVGKPESTAPLPLRLGSASASASVQGKRHYGSRNGDAAGHYREGLGHGPKESQSSASTTTSAESSATFSSILSASTATSATSADSSASASISGTSTSGNTTRESASASSASLISDSSDADADADADSEFGDFEDGHRKSVDQSALRLNADQDQGEGDDEHEQVLMVHDTGATPTMSPNPAFRRAGQANRKRKEPEQVERFVLPETQRATDPEEFDWDDGWGEPAEAQVKDLFGITASASASTGTKTYTDSTSASASTSASSGTTLSSANPDLQPSPTAANASARSKSATAPGSLPPSSFPGLATMGMGAPSAQQMSSWVGNVGKRWGEIKGSTTFTTNQKRASVLLSDMQQSIVSALTSPTTTTGTPTSSTHSTQTRSSQSKTPTTAVSPFSSNAFYTQTQAQTQTQPTSSSNSKPPQPQPQASLLDDSDDESFGESGADDGAADPDNTVRMRLGASSKMTAPVMVPDSLAPGGQTKRVLKTPVKESGPTKDAEEDEWNW